MPRLVVIHLTRKPLSGTVASTALRYGTGSLNIGGCRIGTADNLGGGAYAENPSPRPNPEEWRFKRGGARPLGVNDPKPATNGSVYAGGQQGGTGFDGGSKAMGTTTLGRWPANLILQHSKGCQLVGTHYEDFLIQQYEDSTAGNFSFYAESTEDKPPVKPVPNGQEVEDWQCVPGCPCLDLDQQSGNRRATLTNTADPSGSHPHPGKVTPDSTNRRCYSDGVGHPQSQVYADQGGASRYFKQIATKGEDMDRVPQDLRDYLVTMISPPDPHPKAEFWEGLPEDLAAIPANTLTGLILCPKSKTELTEDQSKELLRILRPGAHLVLVAPDDQPTGHTAVCLVEDVGFEVRDAICWANAAGDGDRLHYVAKAARREREAGCQKLPAKTGAEATDREEGTAGLNNPRAGAGRTASKVRNFHPCLHPEAIVMTDRGHRAIQTIRVGGRVLAADGLFHLVEAVTRHPYTSEVLYRIGVKGTNLTTLASDNHPFLIWRPVRKGNSILGGQVVWASADQVVKGDYTMTPLMPMGTGAQAWAEDPNFWFVFGLWLAEGVSQVAGHGDNCYPSFSLHRKETDLVNRIKALTPRNVSVYEHGENGIQVMAFDPELGAKFKVLGGSGAATKTVHPDVWLLAEPQRRALVEGYLAGDGGTVRTYLQAKSVSTDLATQMTFLAESLGYKTNLFWFKAAPGKIGTRHFKTTSPHYQMQFYSKDRAQTTRKAASPGLVTHGGVTYSLRYVQKVEKVPYHGDVVNLSVEGCPTFQTAVGMSHNTVKPIALMARLLADVPKDQGPVLDPFMGCYDEATEVLTRNGWRFFAEVTDEDECITRNSEGTLEYQRPMARQVYEYDGEMLYFKSRSTDLLVTPNHNMLVQSHADFCAKRPARLVPAESLGQKVYRIPCGGQYAPNGTLLSREMMYLIGLYVTEGYLDSEGHDDIVICQNQGHKWDEMWANIVPLAPRSSGDRKFKVRLTPAEMTFIRKHCGTTKYHKFISPTILQNQHLDALFAAMVLGDGHVTPDGQVQYGTVSPCLADSFQELALKLGWDSTLVSRPPRDSVKGDRLIRGTKPELRVLVRRAASKKINPGQHVSWVPYLGMVYCVTVPNHTLFVRRNGSTSWCGNSGTTVIACRQTGHDAIGIERETEYLRIAETRVRHWDRAKQGWLGAEIVSDLAPAPVETPQEIELDDFWAL